MYKNEFSVAHINLAAKTNSDNSNLFWVLLYEKFVFKNMGCTERHYTDIYSV